MIPPAAAAMCYLLGPLTAIALLVMKPYRRDRRVRFHALQSILLSVAVFSTLAGCNKASALLGLTVGWYRLGHLVVLTLLSVAFYALWLSLLIRSVQGKTVVLPGIGPLAERWAAAGQEVPGA